MNAAEKRGSIQSSLVSVGSAMLFSQRRFGCTTCPSGLYWYWLHNMSQWAWLVLGARLALADSAGIRCTAFPSGLDWHWVHDLSQCTLMAFCTWLVPLNSTGLGFMTCLSGLYWCSMQDCLRRLQILSARLAPVDSTGSCYWLHNLSQWTRQVAIGCTTCSSWLHLYWDHNLPQLTLLVFGVQIAPVDSTESG